MGRTIKLTDAQWDQLDHLRMSTPSADVFRNCTIILMSAVGRSKASISHDLGCCTDTVARVRRLYRKGGAKALLPIKPPGRPSRATPEFINRMKQVIQTNPLTVGYGFSTWSAARLRGASQWPILRRWTESLAVLDGLVLVSQAKVQTKTFHCPAVVPSEVDSALCGCVELPSPRALA